jgi:hypothetical protein
MDACSYPLPYKYSKYLFYSSFFIGLASLMCLYYKDYLSFLIIFFLFLSSIHYWANAINGIARDIDLFLCKFFGLYFYINTFIYKDEFSREIYKYGTYNVIFLFVLEHLFFYYKNPKWIIFHMGVHFYSVFTPFVLYIL